MYQHKVRLRLHVYYQGHRFCTFKKLDQCSPMAVYTLRKNELLTKTVTMTVRVNEPSLFQLSSTKKKLFTVRTDSNIER